MDCAAEEQMVRMALAHIEPPPTLIFDLKNRSLRIVHSGKLSDIQSRLEALRLGAKLQSVRELSANLTHSNGCWLSTGLCLLLS